MTGHRCVIQSWSNRADHAAGISLHRSLANRSEREKRMRFVRPRRVNFNPTEIFVIYSEHFSEDCFERSVYFEGSRRRILSGSVPTVQEEKGQEKPSSVRSRRRKAKSTNLHGFCHLYIWADQYPPLTTLWQNTLHKGKYSVNIVNKNDKIAELRIEISDLKELTFIQKRWKI